ncbi:MAG: hypothetical protein ACJA2D_002875 [Pseudohongiellaceae bacterium]|jgi:hypothetical protein
MKLRMITALLCLGFLFSQSSNASDANQFVGTWLLVHIQSRNDSGDWVIPDSAAGSTGYLTYSNDGYMSFQSEQPGGPDFKNKGFLDFTIEELRAVLSNYGAYFGTYEIDEHANTMTHNVVGNINRSRTGTSSSRTYVFDESQLTLTIGESLRYVWKRP